MMKNSGFTLIELIVVILLFGILSATVIPKFFSSGGFEEYTYRNELMTKLRAIQLRAMQQTDGNECHSVLVTSSKAGLAKNCSTTAFFGDEQETEVITITHDVEFDVPASPGYFSFSFDYLGRPENCLSDPCENITIINGETELSVEINSQGYIYAAP